MSLINFYKIVCNTSGAIYVGSTCMSIRIRLQKHEYDYRQYLENKIRFITSFTILEKNNYNIQLIDSVECVDRKQRDSIELLHILNENCVNKNQPGRDVKQWYQDNKEKVKEHKKQYYQDNKEYFDEYKRQYYQDNKEKLNERHRQYTQDNKEQLDRKRKEKINCPCGNSYTYTNKARHMKSNKHFNYLATL